MFTFFKNLFGGLWSGRDEERRHETSKDDRLRMLQVDEPMAGAGAQLAATQSKSETERALERATSSENQSAGAREPAKVCRRLPDGACLTAPCAPASPSKLDALRVECGMYRPKGPSHEMDCGLSYRLSFNHLLGSREWGVQRSRRRLGSHERCLHGLYEREG